MNYISLTFFAFLLCLLLVYAVIPDRHKWIALLVFSLIFYGYAGLDKLLFVLGTSLVVYVVSLRIEKIWQEFDTVCKQEKLSSVEKKEQRKKYALRSRHIMTVALIVCVGILVWCKYAVTAVGLVNKITGASLTVRVIIPLGVSYYTFSSIGYLADIHWRKIKPEHSYPRLLLCMIYFPQIVEGPIPRYNKLLSQFNKLTFPDYQRFCMGAQLVLWGLIKKMVIADRLGIFVKNAVGDTLGSSGLVFLVALVFAAFRTYADFSGCMDIVMGISEILGIQLDPNFNHPFFSRSAAEFWRRWHITLGNWFKDYVYVPVNSSSLTRTLRRKASKHFGPAGMKAVMTIIPLTTVWLLTGIWHGTGVNYLLWCSYWGGLIICSKLLEDRISVVNQKMNINTESNSWILFQMVRTTCLFILSLLFTISGRLDRVFMAVKDIFTRFNPWVMWDGTLYTYGLDRRNFMLAVLSIVFLMIVEVLQNRMNMREAIGRRNIILRWSIYYLGIFAVLIFGIYGPGYDASAFIYANF